MPHSVNRKTASLVGNTGESYTLHILSSPFPFFKYNLVVEACAKICPPIGNLVSPNDIVAPGFAIT